MHIFTDFTYLLKHIYLEEVHADNGYVERAIFECLMHNLSDNIIHFHTDIHALTGWKTALCTRRAILHG